MMSVEETEVWMGVEADQLGNDLRTVLLRRIDARQANKIEGDALRFQCNCIGRLV